MSNTQTNKQPQKRSRDNTANDSGTDLKNNGKESTSIKTPFNNLLIKISTNSTDESPTSKFLNELKNNYKPDKDKDVALTTYALYKQAITVLFPGVLVSDNNQNQNNIYSFTDKLNNLNNKNNIKHIFDECNKLIETCEFEFVNQIFNSCKFLTFKTALINENNTAEVRNGVLYSVDKNLGSLQTQFRLKTLKTLDNKNVVLLDNNPGDELFFFEEDIEDKCTLKNFQTTTDPIPLYLNTIKPFELEENLSAEDKKKALNDPYCQYIIQEAQKLKIDIKDISGKKYQLNELDKLNEIIGLINNYNKTNTIESINSILTTTEPKNWEIDSHKECIVFKYMENKGGHSSQDVKIELSLGSTFAVYGISEKGITPYLRPLKSSRYNAGLYGRIDDVQDDEYRWTIDPRMLNNIQENSSKISNTIPNLDTVEKIKSFAKENLGLKKSSFIEDLKTINDIEDLKTNEGSKYKYFTLKDKSYVLCNTYHIKQDIHSEITGVNSLPILYFRKVQEVEYNEEKHLKVIKILKEKIGTFKNEPDTTTSGYAIGSNDSSIGVNLPISFAFEENITKFKEYKTAFPTLKNKSNYLKRNPKPRDLKGQNGVMKKALSGKINNQIPGYDKIRANWSGGATAFCNFIYQNYKFTDTDEDSGTQRTSPRDQWQNLKDSDEKAKLPVNQEWCHLMGHGDGGDETSENLVGGSFHCNTEQLAIESAQRHFTHKLGNNRSYKLKVTAYLFDSEGSMTVASNQENGYIKLSQLKNISNKRSKELTNGQKPTDNDQQRLREYEFNKTKTNAPFAQFIRYKIYKEVEVTNHDDDDDDSNKIQVEKQLVKVFDHIFEAQSEFFDKNQANLLYANVMLALGETDTKKLLP